jgi:hypothetical protein
MYTRDEALALDRFPAALQSETLLGQAWVREHGGPYQGFDFNVAVGDGRDPGDGIATPLRLASIEASKRRIDVVAYQPSYVDILEVKGRADPAAIGQLSTYEILWNAQHPDRRVRRVGIIVAVLDPDMLMVFEKAFIQVFVYPDLAYAIRRT